MVNARTTDPVEAILDLGGADVAISLATSPRAFEQAFGSLRRGGRLVCVALPADDTMPSRSSTPVGGKSIIGSGVGARQDLQEVFALHAAGRTEVIATERELDEVNACIEEVLSGEVPAVSSSSSDRLRRPAGTERIRRRPWQRRRWGAEGDLPG